MPLTTELLLALPWLLLLGAFFVVVRPPRALPQGMPDGSARLVSVVIPARDEAHNIERVLGSVCASDWPCFEVIVVDDQSDDGTGTLARGMERGRAERLVVVDGAPLPEGWLGKPWSCAQGAAEARGDLLLFTDADTVHDARLLTRSVAALEEDGAHAVTVLGRQLMESFWERLVQPQIFVMLLGRFRDARRPLPPGRWRDAIANGQYLLIRREVYDAIGGHEAVKDEVAEDLRLAQILVKGGRRLSFRQAEDALATRMYRNLGELVAGWSKNASVGARQTAPGWLRPVLLPAAVLFWTFLWLVPLAALSAGIVGGAFGGGFAALSAGIVGGAFGGGFAALSAGSVGGAATSTSGAAMVPWAAVVVGASVLFWALLNRRMRAPVGYAVLYPLGAAVAVWILARSWWRGTRVEWKGREYRVRDVR